MMKKCAKMNKEQKNYVITKAAYEAIKKTLEDMEEIFCRENNIRKEDGEIAKRFYMMDVDIATPEGEKLFDEVTMKFYDIPEVKEVCTDQEEAYQCFLKAENELIDFAINIAPEGIREILRNGMKNYVHRKKLIDLVMKLDTKTIKKALINSIK